MSQALKRVTTTILSPQRRAGSFSAGDLQTTWPILTHCSWRGCLVAPIQQMGFFLLHCAIANRLLPPMVTAYGGANADVGLVTGAEQRRTRPIKKAVLRRLDRLLKLNFQLTFKLRRAPQTLGK